MTSFRLVGAEMRKLLTTRMPWAFLAVLIAFAALNATLVLLGKEADGSKAFIATAADQQSLVAFAANALMISGLLGAIAVAREYGHKTVVPMFTATPRRHRAVIAQLVAVLAGGATLGLVGASLTTAAVAATLPFEDFDFLMPASAVAQVLAASTAAGAAGAVLGAGIGAVIRNTGGAVTAVFVVLFVAPPLIVQLASGAASWMPNTLAIEISGVGDDIGVVSAIAALAAWAIVPAILGLIAVEKRDIV